MSTVGWTVIARRCKILQALTGLSVSEGQTLEVWIEVLLFLYTTQNTTKKMSKSDPLQFSQHSVSRRAWFHCRLFCQ